MGKLAGNRSTADIRVKLQSTATVPQSPAQGTQGERKQERQDPGSTGQLEVNCSTRGLVETKLKCFSYQKVGF